MLNEKDKSALYDVLTVKEVAAILKISIGSAYLLFKHKDFPTLRTGESKNIRVCRAAFEKWMMCEK